MSLAIDNLLSLTPRNSLVLVQEIEAGDETIAGIIIPQGAGKTLYAIGVILAVGPGTPSLGTRNPDTEDLRPGMQVMFQTGKAADPMARQNSRDDTLPFTVNGNKVLLIDERQVAGIVTTGDLS
jgi:co-chaperonin GroES (HSP10)